MKYYLLEAMDKVAPDEYPVNSGAYMGWTVAEATLNFPAIAERMRYLKVYSPWGRCSKKKLAWCQFYALVLEWLKESGI